MMRLNLVLMVAVVVSALFLVHSQYETRSLFVELERAHADARKLSLERQRLDVERRAQATPERVERLARDQLNMHTTNPAITQYNSRAASAPAAFTNEAAR